jgi:outer membrane protein assembly factor BamB
MKKILLALVVLGALPMSSGCKWFKSPTKENLEPPTELTDIPNALNVEKLWSKGLGKGVGKAGLRLKPAHMDGRLFASDGGGEVYALDPANGSVIWNTDTKTDIGSSPASAKGSWSWDRWTGT